MLRIILTLGGLAALLTGCMLPGASPVPTPYPADYLPTVVALTGEAAFMTAQALTPIASPTFTPRPTSTTSSPTPLPTLTFTPIPKVPKAQIQFLTPGPMSKIVSPVQLQMLVVAGESDVIQIDLYGEDGRLLGRKIDRITRRLSGVYATYKIPFEIRAAAETAYLQVSSKDRAGRLQALNTLQLILLSAGTNEITPAGNVIFERAVLDVPRDKADVLNGVINVEGRFWPFNEQPVFLEVILPDKSIPVLRVLTFNGLETQEFSTTLPYTVTEPVLARLSLRQMDPVLNAPVYVYTQEITLNP